jgi:hypothetical protein
LRMRITRRNGEQSNGKQGQLKTSRHRFDLLLDDSSSLTIALYFGSRHHQHSRR